MKQQTNSVRSSESNKEQTLPEPQSETAHSTRKGVIRRTESHWVYTCDDWHIKNLGSEHWWHHRPKQQVQYGCPEWKDAQCTKVETHVAKLQKGQRLRRNNFSSPKTKVHASFVAFALSFGSFIGSFVSFSFSFSILSFAFDPVNLHPSWAIILNRGSPWHHARPLDCSLIILQNGFHGEYHMWLNRHVQIRLQLTTNLKISAHHSKLHQSVHTLRRNPPAWESKEALQPSCQTQTISSKGVQTQCTITTAWLTCLEWLSNCEKAITTLNNFEHHQKSVFQQTRQKTERKVPLRFCSGASINIRVALSKFSSRFLFADQIQNVLMTVRASSVHGMSSKKKFSSRFLRETSKCPRHFVSTATAKRSSYLSEISGLIGATLNCCCSGPGGGDGQCTDWVEVQTTLGVLNGRIASQQWHGSDARRLCVFHWRNPKMALSCFYNLATFQNVLEQFFNWRTRLKQRQTICTKKKFKKTVKI